MQKKYKKIIIFILHKMDNKIHKYVLSMINNDIHIFKQKTKKESHYKALNIVHEIWLEFTSVMIDKNCVVENYNMWEDYINSEYKSIYDDHYKYNYKRLYIDKVNENPEFKEIINKEVCIYESKLYHKYYNKHKHNIINFI